MILQFDNPDPRDRLRDSLTDSLLEKAPALCGNAALASSPIVCEAAQGVAAVLEEREQYPHELTPHTACNLLSRALQAAGEPSLARRLSLAGTASVYAASWITTGDETVWTLDVKRLTDADAPCTELLVFERLREMFHAYADVWDHTSGRGVLGLKRLADVAAAILGPHAAPSEIRRLSAELRDYCGQYLDLQRQRRGWQATPVIMSVES